MRGCSSDDEVYRCSIVNQNLVHFNEIRVAEGVAGGLPCV